MVDDTRRTTDDGQRYGYGISLPAGALKILADLVAQNAIKQLPVR